jgi:Rrf2 family transcriptional regulator, nitric oxide-sensitive transcriptional repressor
MRLLSEAGEYAVRAVVFMAWHPGETHKTHEIAERIHAAPGYLVKILQRLARAGILSAARGSRGGFTLERAADGLTVLEVLAAVDPLQRIRRCPLGLEEHEDGLCPMHRRVDEALAAVEACFAGTFVGALRHAERSESPFCRSPTGGGAAPARRRAGPPKMPGRARRRSP